MIGLGVLGLIQRDFPPTWSGVPKGLPARQVLVYLCAFVSLATGLGLLWRRSAAVASRGLLAFFLFLVWGPVVVAGPSAFQWSEFVDSWALTAGAWVVAESHRGMAWR